MGAYLDRCGMLMLSTRSMFIRKFVTASISKNTCLFGRQP